MPPPWQPRGTSAPEGSAAAASSAARACFAVTWNPFTSFRTPSHVSPTTGRLHGGVPGTLSSDQRIISSCTTPTECVFVMQIGVVKKPDSRIHSRPVISPFPLSRCVPAKSGCADFSTDCGKIAVTPVRTGPLPRTNAPSPEMIVSAATRTPATSLIALRGPCAKRPIVMPRSLARSGRLIVALARRRRGRRPPPPQDSHSLHDRASVGAQRLCMRFVAQMRDPQPLCRSPAS